MLEKFTRLVAKTRIPLPGKVFLSYLLVVLVGALPTYFYLRQVFIQEFINDAVQHVAVRAQLLANFLSDHNDMHERLAELRHFAPVLNERITYIGVNGRVLFDSEVGDLHALESHLGRPEVARALGKLGPDESLDIKLPSHVGIARRISESTHEETLYVAVRIVNDAGVGNDCLRLAMPMAEVAHLSELMVRVFRNSQAGAVSLAIILSMIAAIVFMRPLQRLRVVATALSQGDYTVHVGPLGRDEIGDVGRSLEELGQELRKRLAVAEAGEAMLVQLVHGVHLPIAIFGPEGRVVALNGAARDAFSKQQSHADDNFMGFVKSQVFQAASERAQMQGEPTELTYAAPDGTQVAGWMHVLQHPASPPYCAFLGEESVRRPSLRLLRPAELQAVRAQDAFAEAQRRVQGQLQGRGITLLFEGTMPDVALCDSHDRLILALTTALCGLPQATTQQEPVIISVTEKATRLAFIIHAGIHDAAGETAAFLLTPLGGRLKAGRSRCILFLAKA